MIALLSPLLHVLSIGCSLKPHILTGSTSTSISRLKSPILPLATRRGQQLSMMLNVSPNLRGVFAGSGSDGLNDPTISSADFDLTGKSAGAVNVLYLGTAMYDLPEPMRLQTERFREAGCTVRCLNLVDAVPPVVEIKEALGSADVVLASGGNTLFGVDRWNQLGNDIAMMPLTLRIIFAG